MNTIDCSIECPASFSEGPILGIAHQTLAFMRLDEVELSIVLCDDAFIHPLNRDYRGKNQATDVLSFSQREGEFADANDPVLGDVIISVETAQRQADERGHHLGRELTVLLIHGILHLLGYDHISDDDAEVMEAIEASLLPKVQVEWPEDMRYTPSQQ